MPRVKMDGRFNSLLRFTFDRPEGFGQILFCTRFGAREAEPLAFLIHHNVSS